MRRLRLAFLGLTMAMLCVFGGGLSAQNQLVVIDDIEQQFGRNKYTFTQKSLGAGEPAPAATLELASRYYVLRVTDAVAIGDPKKMGDYVQEFQNMVATASLTNNAKVNRDVVAKFAPHLVARFKEVFALDPIANRIAIVNAAVMLPALGKLRHESIGEYLASLMAEKAVAKEKTPADYKTILEERVRDVIRNHAAKGLREFFPTTAFTKTELNQGPKTKQAQARKDFDVKCVDALLKFVDRPLPPLTVSAEELDAVRYMRKEAVKTLAMTGVPAVSSMSGSVEGPVALGLIKVLSKKVTPEPTVQERLEAAIGVCYFSKWVEEYDPKVGVYLVGECLNDFFGMYKQDIPNINAKAKGKPTYFPWKHTAKRVQAALADLTNNTRGTPAGAGAQKMESIARSMLDEVYQGVGISRETEFRAAVQALRPTTKVLFKNQKGTMLEFEWQAAATAEEK